MTEAMIGAVIGGLVTLIPAITTAVIVIRRQTAKIKGIQSKERRVDRSDTISEMEEFVAELKSAMKQQKAESRVEVNQLKAEITRLSDAHDECRKDHAEAGGHIRYLEHVMRTSGIKFEAWEEYRAKYENEGTNGGNK